MRKALSSVVSRLLPLGACALLALAPLRGQAQQAPPAPAAWLDVLIIEVKPGHAPEVEDLMKKLSAAVRKANQPPAQIFQVVRGEQTAYHVVNTHQALAENDTPQPPPLPPQEMANFIGQLTPNLASVRSFLARSYPQYSMQGTGGAPQLAVLQTTRVVAGRGDDYLRWVESDLMPAMRKANAAGTTTSIMSRGVFGDSPQNFYRISMVANWAALDSPNPVAASMGQAAYERMQAKLIGIVESTELTLVRPRPDLANPMP